MIERMIAALALLAASASAETPAQPPEQPQSFVATNDRVLRMTIPTQVNDQGPFAFTIDTGSDRSVVSDRLAGALALPAGRQVIVHGIIGPELVPTVKVDRLKIGLHEQRNISAPVLPERALGATGFLGVDALADQALILDFKRKRVTMTRSDRDASDPETIVVTGRSRFGQLILTDAHIGNRKVYAIIDTGAQGSVGNLQLRRLLLGSTELHANNGLVGVTGAEIPAEDGIIPRIRLGGLNVTDMQIAFADAHTFRKFGVDDVPTILIGMDLLRRFDRVAVDFRRREVRFVIGDGGETVVARAAGDRLASAGDGAPPAP